MNLTERRIEKLTVEHGRKDALFFDDTQRGLAVRITAKGSRSYLAQYTLHGRKFRLPLGSCEALSLAKAREAAATIMGDVAKGKNPASERREAATKAKRAKDRLTLGGLINDWERLHLSQRRPGYAAEATRALRRAFAAFLDRPAEELDRTTVVRVLDAMVQSRVAGEDGEVAGASNADRTAAYARAAYGWAIKRGTVQFNPFAGLPSMAAVTKRERVLTDKELASIWRASGDATFPFGAIVRMLALTGQRRDEVAGMAWAELSDDLSTWTIPGARTKNSKPHIVPLNIPAQEILRNIPRKGALLFPNEKGSLFNGWSKSKAKLDKAASVSGWRIHDLRRTLATGLQRLGVRLEVTEAVLNHVSGSRSGIVGVYQRHDWANEKRAALDGWAAHVAALDSPSAVAFENVVRPAFGPQLAA
jgi:integrase